ncbi:hypothetical protein ACQB6R_02285 [Propionibacteriaceae bacterium G1746]
MTAWDLEEFDRHITKLNAVCTDMRTAAGTGASLGVADGLMYGILPSPLVVPILSTLNGHGDDMLAALAEANEVTRDAIKQTRADYQFAEESGVSQSKKVEDDIVATAAQIGELLS